MLDAYRGTEKTIALQSEPGAKGHSSHAHLQVTIPKGVHEGQQIRLAGHGIAGTGGGPAGDLLLDVHFKKDAQWHTRERDVYGPLALAPWEAELGPWLAIQTPDGEAEVKIPEGWKAGRTLRISGRGIPATTPAKAAGDLYLELVITCPPARST